MKIDQYVEKSLILAIGSSYDTIWRDFNAKLQKEGCSYLQALILISLFFENSDFVKPSILAKTLKTSRGNISHSISYLEKKGLLKRNLDPKDARSYQILLKNEGRKMALRFIKLINALEGIFEDHFGKIQISRTIEQIKRLEEVYLIAKLDGKI